MRGVTGAILGLGVSSLVQLGFISLALRRHLAVSQIRFDVWHCLAEYKVLLQTSLPLTLSMLLAPATNWGCLALLANSPGGYAAVGGFSAANQWYLLISFLPGMLAFVTLPILAEQRNTNQRGRILKVTVLLNVLSGLPVVVLGGFFASPIMRLYGSEFAAEWPTLIVVLLTGLLRVIVTPLFQFLVAADRVWLGFATYTVGCSAFLTATLSLLHWGSLGLATARLAGHVLLVAGLLLSVYGRQVLLGTRSPVPVATRE